MEKSGAVIKGFCVLMLAFLFCAGLSGNAMACSACNYDYGDAPTSYGSAAHSSSTWQKLGSGWSSEGSPRAVDTYDDGVAWSIDNGATWGTPDLTRGQAVVFRFDFQRAAWGIHDWDQLKAWVDWNGNGTWDNASEKIIAVQWAKGNTQWSSDEAYNRAVAATGNSNPRGAQLQQFFYTDSIIIPVTGFVGETWLRARVVCSADIGKNPANLKPVGGLNGDTTRSFYQGEVEDWKLRINPAPVPEPATMLLLGLGLSGIAVLRRKFKK